jgi:hypothetical protein
MRRELIGKGVGAALCLALALVPYLTDVRHAGYYAVAGAFGGGLVLGFLAIVVEVAAWTALATVFYFTGWMQPEHTDQSPTLIFPICALGAVFLAIPTFAGGAVRAFVRGGRRAPRTPAAPAARRP